MMKDESIVVFEEKKALMKGLGILGVAFVIMLVLFSFIRGGSDVSRVLVSFAMSTILYIPIRVNHMFHNGFLGSALIFIIYWLILGYLVDTISDYILVPLMLVPLILIGKRIYLLHKYRRDESLS